MAGHGPDHHSNHGIWPTAAAPGFAKPLAALSLRRRRGFFAGNGVSVAQRRVAVLRRRAGRVARRPMLISGPSNSPENGGLVMGPTMDHQIIRNCSATPSPPPSSGGRPDFAAELGALRKRIAPNAVGRLDSFRSGSKTWTTPRTSTATSRTSSACTPASRLRPTARRSFRRRPQIASNSAATARPAGRWAGRSTGGRVCSTATTLT